MRRVFYNVVQAKIRDSAVEYTSWYRDSRIIFLIPSSIYLSYYFNEIGLHWNRMQSSILYKISNYNDNIGWQNGFNLDGDVSGETNPLYI